MLAALAVSVLVVGVSQSKEKSGKSENEVQAPQFTLKNYDGKEVSLSDYAGKIVVLEWFNYECPFVKYHYEKPKTMASLAAKYKDKDVVWLAVNSTKHLKTEKNKAFAEEHKLGYPILDDRSGKVGRAYSAKTTPHMFIIDAKGRIVYDGGIDNSPMGSKKEKAVNYVDKALVELTAGKAVSIPKTKPYGCSVKYAR
jgi:peroxiredoxin